jgi:hypothetical protein
MHGREQRRVQMHFAGSRLRWEDNIKMSLKYAGKMWNTDI